MTDRRASTRVLKLAALGFSGALLGLATMAVVGVYGARMAGIDPIRYSDGEWLPVAGEDADYAARAAGAAFKDTQEFWSRRFRTELGRAYRSAGLVYFTAATPSPCAGASNAAGPFYCYITETVALDLTFLDLIGGRMFYRGDAGMALMVARIAAVHVQGQLGALEELRRAGRGATGAQMRSLELEAALQADCLTGVWAHHAADWVAKVEASFYGQLILSAREVNRGRPNDTVEPDPALLGPGTQDQRAAAFAKGRNAGAIAVCR